MQKQLSDISIFFDGLDHPECVAIHPDGSVWAGGEAGQIYRISCDGKKCDEIVNTGGFILGIAFSCDSAWLAICDLKNHCIWRFDIETQLMSYLAGEASGNLIHIPNYPVFDERGNLYITDSGSFRQINGRILKIDINGKVSVWHKGPFNFPNGMALSANKNALYVVCSWLPGVEKINILSDGSPGVREVVVSMPKTCPDGIALDVKGNLYISCYAPNAIYKVDGKGQIDLLVDDWEAHTISNPTNIAFGGPERKHLFIANLGRWHISLLELDNAGLLLPCFKK